MNWQDYQPGKRVVSLLDFSASASVGRYSQLKSCPSPGLGEIVTIKSTEIVEGSLALHLVEYEWGRFSTWCTKCRRNHDMEFAFSAQYFRPLDESKLDQFRVHLQGQPVAAPKEVGAPSVPERMPA